MRSITILFILFFIYTNCKANIFTFHTEGDYTDEGNWDMYPGTDLLSDDTISIEANCSNITLHAYDGYVVFSEDVSNIEIVHLEFSDNSQLEFKSDWFQMHIFAQLDTYSNNPVIFSNNTFIDITNSGSGVSFNAFQDWQFTNILYFNFGTQDAQLLEIMNGQFNNFGFIDVTQPMVYLNCDLELSNGLINGAFAFDLFDSGGTISQGCSSCTATINNINNLYLDRDTYINGNLILNGPN